MTGGLQLPFPEVALVTGASSGIGRATALRLAVLGSKMVVGYNSRAEAAEAALVAERFGRLDALVNNAGSTTPVPAGDLDGLTDDIFDRTVRLNLRGPFSIVRALRPLLEKGDNAAIVNVSSLAAQ